MVLGAALTFVATFLMIAVGFCLTLHIAARYVLGDVRLKNALAGVIPAAVVFSLTYAGWSIPAAVIGLGADAVAIRSAYDLRYRIVGLVTLVHFTVSFLVAFTLRNLLLLLGTAPT